MKRVIWVGRAAWVITCVLLVGSVEADVETQDVAYVSGDSTVVGYLAVPQGEGPFPGLVVIHEWWGLNEQIKAETRKFAKSGYAALAVDLYEGTVATTPNAAMAAMRSVEESAAAGNLNDAVEFLREHAAVREDAVGSIGWCFGGGKSLELALDNPNLAAAVIYYGRLQTDPEVLKKIRCPILGQFGEDDRSPSVDLVNEFRKGLAAAGIVHEIHIYSNASHAFANPTGTRYKKEAAEKAWARTAAFLNKNLMKGK